MADPVYDDDGIDLITLTFAVVLAAALALLIARILPPLADLIMPPAVIGSASPPTSSPARLRLQRDQVVADAGNPLDQALAGRLVPAVNGVGVVGHGAILPDSRQRPENSPIL